MYQNLAEVSFLNYHCAGSRNWCIWKETITIVYRPSKYDHKEIGGVLEKDNSISFSEFHVSVFKGERVAFHSLQACHRTQARKEKVKNSLQAGIVQKARDLRRHKHRYAQKVKNNLENGFRSWSCSLVMTFFSVLKKNMFSFSTFLL